ncbi:serine/threonine protein kinase AGC family, partial [Phycomyces blakesleeanus NRRL 1555(-)]
VNLAQFESIRMIGKGSFGKVRMVRHVERRDECYAMKCISKEHCIKLNAVRNIIRERTILEQLAHPLVCNMRFAFHDASTMYMVMDLMLGGDMRFHISRQRHPENVIRFWMAELICAVKYLHFQGFVHRDIKPDNILLDQEGHIHLTDFNIACSIPRKPQSLLRSRSGTIVYFAPEVFKGHGYNEDVDWWSVGITFYECIYGKRPWPGNETAEELAQTVLRGTICYPSTEGRSVSPSCVSAIQGFLEYEPNNRLGHGTSGWNRLVQHPFFHSVNWNAIDTKQTTPPFRPSSSQGNFDAIYDIEDLLVHSSGSISPRAANWFFRSSQPSELDERRVRLLKEIDEKFKPFDYT